MFAKEIKAQFLRLHPVTKNSNLEKLACLHKALLGLDSDSPLMISAHGKRLIKHAIAPTAYECLVSVKTTAKITDHRQRP